MSYLFTSESVSEGHPDKICDQISDALLDNFLAQDPESKVACETLVTTGLVVCAGEVKTEGYVSVDDVVRKVIEKIGYNKSDYQFDYKSPLRRGLGSRRRPEREADEEDAHVRIQRVPPQHRRRHGSKVREAAVREG